MNKQPQNPLEETTPRQENPQTIPNQQGETIQKSILHWHCDAKIYLKNNTQNYVIQDSISISPKFSVLGTMCSLILPPTTPDKDDNYKEDKKEILNHATQVHNDYQFHIR